MPSAETNLAMEAASSPCVACRLPLPLRPKPAAEVGQYWVCVRCGTKHHGVLLDNAPRGIAGNVRPADPPQVAAVKQAQREHAPQGVASRALSSRGRVRCTQETPASREVDSAVASAANLSNQPIGPPFLNGVKSHAALPYDPIAMDRFNQHYDDSLQQVESFVRTLEQGRPLDLAVPEAITRDALVKATQDLDLFVRLGINPPAGDYPGRHSLHVAMLAAAVGANLGWDEKTLTELGVGCLLHDVGMLRVPKTCYDTDQVLDDGQFVEIVRHPLHTFDLLADNYSRVPLASRMVAFQIHERTNGSGYPRNRSSEMIHEAAKVAAVADVYVALVSPRPHRPALMPYYAMEHLLYEVKNGTFEGKAVRALLKTISLFPIGSYLALADGRVGRVIRANGEHYGRPIIEAWQEDQLDLGPVVVDLAQEPQTTIRGPLPRLEDA